MGAVLCFAAAASVRSNGVLLMGFPLADAIGLLLRPRRLSESVKLLALSVVVAVPLVLHEAAARARFCTGESQDANAGVSSHCWCGCRRSPAGRDQPGRPLRLVQPAEKRKAVILH